VPCDNGVSREEARHAIALDHIAVVEHLGSAAFSANP
jgi:hypothetical protein